MFDIARRRAEDFIPGDIGSQRRSILDYRPPERSLTPPKGSAQFRYEKETHSLIICFYDNLLDPELILRALRSTREDYGADSVQQVVLLLSAEAMQDAGGIWLDYHKYERVLSSNPKASLYRWVKKLKPRKVKEETE